MTGLIPRSIVHALAVGTFVTPLAAVALKAQSAALPGTQLRRDGNGAPALRAIVTSGFMNVSATNAFKALASQAGLNLTFDPVLAGLSTTVAIPAHERSVGVALIEIADAAQLSVRVLAGDQLVVVAMPVMRSVVSDTAARRPVALAVVRTEATRVERRTFETSTSVGAVSVTGAELRSTPSFIEPDVLRSTQALPGVEARSDYAAGFNVRGGEADQNLILLDGYPIYNPFHLGGLFSTFIDPTVGRVNLQTGALSPAYGERLSGLLDVRSAEPMTPEVHGTAEVSLVSAIASLGRSFATDSGSWMIAARRTYADAIVDVFKHDGFPYHFQDVQGHVARSFASGWKVSATGYAGADLAGSTADSDGADASWGNGVAGLTVARTFDRASRLLGLWNTDSIALTQRFSMTRFDAHVEFPDILYRLTNTLHEARLGGTVIAYRGTSETTFGYEAAQQHLAFIANAPLADLGDIVPFDSLRQREQTVSAFAVEQWRPRDALLVSIGGRVDHLAERRWTGVSPRVSMKYFVGPNTAIAASAGVYAQWMHSLGREEEVIEPLQYWVMGNANSPVSSARELTLGAEHWLSPTRLFHAETFYKRYDHLLIPNPLSDPTVPADELQTATGTSYGADLLLRQLERGPFSGWISYSYAVNTRIGADGVRYFPAQDRRHNANVVGSWRLNSYSIGLRLNAATGYPFTQQLGAYARERYNPITRQWSAGTSESDEVFISGARNGDRLPWYFRADVGFTRDGHIRGAQVSPYLSVLNVTNAHNPAAYLYDFDGVPRRGSLPNLPFVPTLGVRVAY
ncbi:MAG TPA: TonB-dependent receptor plug domain-containing protein [Gemmatimonadaceae bacterium]